MASDQGQLGMKWKHIFRAKFKKILQEEQDGQWRDNAETCECSSYVVDSRNSIGGTLTTRGILQTTESGIDRLPRPELVAVLSDRESSRQH